MSNHDAPTSPSKPRRRIRKAVGKRLRPVLLAVFALFALLALNSVYLLGVRVLESATGETYQNWFYLIMFLGHLALGALIVVPVIMFGVAHIRNTYNRPNRRAVKVGYALWICALVLLASGVVLTRLEGIIVVKDPFTRSIAWWAHVITPVLAAWLFVLHRLAGPRINWTIGRRWAMASGALLVVFLVLQAQDPRGWNQVGPDSGEQYFFPSLARTQTGNFIPADVLQNDQYCQRCHPDAHDAWANSVHRFSSFNNPPYAFSVGGTRDMAQARDGNVQASRFCAGCHDPVPFFSGQFDDPDFDFENSPTGQAGITCTVCHSITNINSVRGNADYTIDEPLHYPFAFAESSSGRWLGEQLIKSKPELHKRSFLKDFHREPEFCGSCHKVHLPEELNHYKFLRGQNHYDTYHLSGVSGHGITSFYYPQKAEHNCNGCHMPARESDDFGARPLDGADGLAIHDHMFPSANTGIPHLLGLPDWVNEAHQAFNEGVVRVDLFGLKKGSGLDGELVAPLRPELPVLEPGASYVLEAVIRTLKMGHPLTQGTADSNELWMDVTVSSGDRVIGRSGGRDDQGRVDPWSHFVNVYMLDREGRRIDRRNAEDIFVPLYNHQIPPGAADVIHYGLDLPRDLAEPVRIDVALRYRKFDTTYMKHVYGDDFVNDLPVITMAVDSIVLPIAGGGGVESQTVDFPVWQRWNDYGIGLLRKGGKSKGELRQAEAAFRTGRGARPPRRPAQSCTSLPRAQGTVEDLAIEALERAATFDPPAYPWSVAWFTGLVNKENGFLDEAIANFRSILDASSELMREREFDFNEDYRLLNELGLVLFERAKQERGEGRAQRRGELLAEARELFERALVLDPENVTAHFNLDLILRQLGDETERADYHRERYLQYKPDDNARDRAIAIARAADPAADHAAEAIVIYDLDRPGAFELPGTRRPTPSRPAP